MTSIPQTEGIKYAGSKLKIIPYIIELIGQLSGVESVLDGFSGSTRVSQALAQSGYTVTANDLAVWSECMGKCYLLDGRSDEYYGEVIDYLNSLSGYEGWFTENYGGEPDDSKRAFRAKNTRKLDAIRDEIERLKLDDIDKSVVLTSLMLALDKVDNTMGHYVSYLNKWSARSNNDLVLRVPHRFGHGGVDNRVVRGDIFDLIGEQRSYDLAYFDPPYGSNNEKMPPSRVRYAAYYHIWTSVILNDRPKLFGKASRREDSRDNINGGSVFEEFRREQSGRYMVMEALERLITQTKARYLLISYSSEGRASREELMEIVNSNGRLVSVVEIDYKRNVMSRMSWTKEWINSQGRYVEYLILLEK